MNNKDRVVVMSAQKKPYDKAYIQQLRQQARASVEQIKEIPSINSFYESVDKCWESPAFRHQTKFENKDQHYSYITEYYHNVIEKMTLEEYKQLVLSDLMNRLDSAEALLESDKIISAAKEHKKQEDALIKDYQNQVDDLKDRNEKVMKDIFNNDK
jgi:hypothetical protein